MLKSIKEIRYYLVILIIMLNSISAEENNFRFEKLSLEEGISHNLVYSILQDQEGFMWFGTMFGLVRYDGRNFKSYRHMPGESNSLSDDDIVTIFESRNQNLWIGTFGGGLNNLNKSNDSIRRYSPEFFNLPAWSGIIWSITEDNKNNIWIATQGAGIIKFNPFTDEFELYNLNGGKSDSKLPNSSRNIYCDSQGNIWAAGTGFISKYDVSQNEFVKYQTEEQPGLTFFSIINFNDDVLLCGSNNGILLFDKDQESFLKVSNMLSYHLKGEFINTLTSTKRNGLMAGTENGLYLLDSSLCVRNHFSEENSNLPGNSIVTINEDKSGIIWLGSYLGGISKLLINMEKFKFITASKKNDLFLSDDFITGIAEDISGNIWITTRNGLNKLNKDLTGNEIYFSSTDQKKLSPDSKFNSIIYTPKEDIILGTNEGVWILNKNLSVLKKITVQDGLGSNIINVLTLGSSKNLWIGTTNGVFMYEFESGKIYSANHFAKSGKIIGNYVLSVYFDLYDNLWIGTYSGLTKINLSSGKTDFFKPSLDDSHELSNKYVFSFYERTKTELWIATGGGINIYDREKNTFSFLTEKEGLPNGVINGFVPDSRGNIYISTNKGLSRYDTQTKQFVNYDSRDGLLNNIYSRGAALLTSTGKIIFGGLKGLTVIDNNNFFSNETKPLTEITSVKIFGNELGKTQWINGAVLDYDKNFVSFEFAGLEFSNPEKNIFAYMLEGIDSDWQYTSSNSVTYKNLSPGNYKFLLKSSNNDGIWSDKVAMISLRITPPFWNTWWFYTLIITVLLLTALAFHILKLRRSIKHAVDLEEARRNENERVRKRAAQDFHDEIGHRLTRISLLIEIVKQKLISSDPSQLIHLDKITSITTNLSSGMRDFIWTLDPDRDSLYDALIRLKDFGDELFDKTGIAFRVEGISDELQQVNLSMDWRRHLTLIFKEGMNNIIKYAGCKNVKLFVSYKNGELNISLEDDGKGIDFSKLFKGNGLRNMKSRAQYLKGAVDVISGNNEGTKVIFRGLLGGT